MKPRKLPRKFFARPTLKVARELLGKFLVVKKTPGVKIPDLTGKDPGSTGSLLIGKIVETEAYIGVADKACHASWRRRQSCEVMWGPPGFAYVYFTYGLHWMLNVVTEVEGFPAAVLIRAIEPTDGLDIMTKNRKLKMINEKMIKLLANGPAKLTQALGIDGSFNGEDLVKGKRIWIESRGVERGKLKIESSPRIGVEYAQEYKDKPWRLFLKDSSFVSKKGG